MFTDKIDPIICNGVETIGGNYILFQKGLAQLSGTVLTIRGN